MPLLAARALGLLSRRAATPTTSRRSRRSSKRSPTPGCSSASGSDVVPEPAADGRRLSRSPRASAIGARAVPRASRPRARRAVSPIVEFLRAIPPPALLPFAILVIGVGDSMKVFIIAFVCLWPVLLNTIDGVTGVDLTLRETASAYRIRTPRPAPPRDLLPAATPQIFAGMRTSLSLALILMVISEMVAVHQRDRILRPAVASAPFAIPEMWSGHHSSGTSGLPAQRGVRAHREARPALAPRRPRPSALS